MYRITFQNIFSESSPTFQMTFRQIKKDFFKSILIAIFPFLFFLWTVETAHADFFNFPISDQPNILVESSTEKSATSIGNNRSIASSEANSFASANISPITRTNIETAHLTLQIKNYYDSNKNQLTTLYEFSLKKNFHINPVEVNQDFLIPTSTKVFALDAQNQTDTLEQKNNLTSFWSSSSKPITKKYYGLTLEVYEGGDNWIIDYSQVNAPKGEPLMKWHAQFRYQPCDPTLCYPPETVVASFSSPLTDIPPTPTDLATPAFAATNMDKGQQQTPKTFEKFKTIGLFILIGLLGGVILNFMPCVLPVVSIKFFSLLKNHEKNSLLLTEKKFNRYFATISLSHLAGISFVFISFASLIVVLRKMGLTVSWGFQFQNSFFILSLAILFLCLFLEMSDLTHFSSRLPKIFSPIIRRLDGFKNQKSFSTHQKNSSTHQKNLSTHQKNLSTHQKSLSSKEGSRIPYRSDIVEHFFSGILLVIVSTPCTAPFFGVAISYAFSRNLFEIFTIFLSLSIGFAFPYCLLVYSLKMPSIRRWIPKPGPWMIKMKHLLAIPILLTAMWLVSLVVNPLMLTDTDPNGRASDFSFDWLFSNPFVPSILISISLFGLILLMGKIKHPKMRLSKAYLSLVLIALLTLPLMSMGESIGESIGESDGEKKFSSKGLLSGDFNSSADKRPVYFDDDKGNAKREKDSLEWVPFTEQNYQAALASNRPIFLHFTADWCLTCKITEQGVLKASETRRLFEKNQVIPMRGDITHKNTYAEQYMKNLGILGIPLDIVHLPSGHQNLKKKAKSHFVDVF